MIQFVQVGFLAGLLAIAIPLAIHLVRGRRGRHVNLGTLRFLEIALRENVYRRKLKRWLLLALRILAVSCLAFLFARPFIVSGSHLSGADNVVILIDQSASMTAETGSVRPIDRAVERAQQIVAGCREDTRIVVASFDSEVHSLEESRQGASGQAADKMRLPQALADLRAAGNLFAGTDYGAALRYARDVLLGFGGKRQALYILTDLQRSGLDQATPVPLPGDTAIRVIDVGQSYRNNVAATRLTAAPDLVRPGDATTITAVISNSGSFPTENMTVVLRLVSGERQQTMREAIQLKEGGTQEVDFTYQELSAGLWTGMVSVEMKDELPCDNRRFTAILVAPPDPILLIDGQPGSMRTSDEVFFLDAALRLASGEERYVDTPFDPQSVATGPDGQFSLPDLAEFRLVVLANVGTIPGPVARRLAEFVQGGGGLCAFAGDNVTADGYRAAADVGLTVGAIDRPLRATSTPWRMERWNREHALFQPFADPEHGDLRRVGFRTYLPIHPDEDARVIAWFQDDRPAILEKSLGRGKIIWFTSTCDGDWGDWPRSRLYVPLLHQMLSYLLGRAEGGPIHQITFGEATTGKRDQEPGVYQRDTGWDVVNLNGREAELDRVGEREFADRCGLVLDKVRDEVDEADAPADADVARQLRKNEIWPWLAFGLMGVLLFEFFLANRTPA